MDNVREIIDHEIADLENALKQLENDCLQMYDDYMSALDEKNQIKNLLNKWYELRSMNCY